LKIAIKIFSKLPLRKHFLIGSLLVLVSVLTSAQLNVQGIGNTIKQGDAKGLSAYFDKQIDLTFSDKSTTCSKKQAELIIQRFFSKVEPNSFLNIQQGHSKNNNTKFLLGSMASRNGVYNVYMFFIRKNGVYVLRELRFEK
jgi:predicted small secreted protein